MDPHGLFTAAIPSPDAHWSVDDHRAFAHQLQKMWQGVDFYIEQFHEKKSEMRRGGAMHARCKEDDRFYKRFLFHGEKRRCSTDVFPASYMAHLEARSLPAQPAVFALPPGLKTPAPRRSCSSPRMSRSRRWIMYTTATAPRRRRSGS